MFCNFEVEIKEIQNKQTNNGKFEAVIKTISP